MIFQNSAIIDEFFFSKIDDFSKFGGQKLCFFKFLQKTYLKYLINLFFLLCRSLVEMRAHLAAYDRCSASTWVCDECPKTFGAERSLRIHTLQIHQTELICDKCAKNFGTDHKKFLRHLQRAHITEEKKKDRMYKCGECTRSFDYEKNLERHLVKHKVNVF